MSIKKFIINHSEKSLIINVVKSKATTLTFEYLRVFTPSINNASKPAPLVTHKKLVRLNAIENIGKHGANNAKVIEINAMDTDAVTAAADLQAPFDVIVLTAAVKEIPAHIEALLKDGGQIMAFIGSNPVLSLVHKRKIGATWQQTGLFETLLQDMEGCIQKRQFVF